MFLSFIDYSDNGGTENVNILIIRTKSVNFKSTMTKSVNIGTKVSKLSFWQSKVRNVIITNLEY